MLLVYVEMYIVFRKFADGVMVSCEGAAASRMEDVAGRCLRDDAGSWSLLTQLDTCPVSCEVQ